MCNKIRTTWVPIQYIMVLHMNMWVHNHNDFILTMAYIQYIHSYLGNIF